MKLVALDLETTGLEPHEHQILRVGMVCFDSNTGESIGTEEFVVRHSTYWGDPYALSMNHEILRRLSDPATGEGVSEMGGCISEALHQWGFAKRPIAVGFNVAPFDIAFLKAAGVDVFSHRAIELGSLLMNMFAKDEPVTSNQAAEHLGLSLIHI